MLPTYPTYPMKQKSKYRDTLCGQCGQRIRPTKLFSIDPIDSRVVYHAQCYIMKTKGGHR